MGTHYTVRDACVHGVHLADEAPVSQIHAYHMGIKRTIQVGPGEYAVIAR